MARAVKIRELRAPSGDLRTFDPGGYLCSLEFYPTEEPLGESERDGLAQMIHYLAFLTLRAHSPAFETSLVPHASTAYLALQTYFGDLEGWADLPSVSGSLPYLALTSFLMDYYPPPLPAASVFTRLARWWKGKGWRGRQTRR